MLKLVVDNSKKIKGEDGPKLKTCREDCFLYNNELECCPIFNGVDLDDPLVAYRCQEFQDKDWWTNTESDEIAEGYADEELLEMLAEGQEIEGFDFLVTGERYEREDKYPLEPSLPLNSYIEGLYWYKAPDSSFGCWVLNESKSQLMNVSDIDSVQKGWSDKVYRSPIPLHDHNSTKELNSRVCWYVDHDGWGQYGLIVGNKLAFLTNPRPSSWK